jgi:hypothetical protein
MPFGSIGSFHAMARAPAVMPQMNIAPVGVTILSSTATSITISFTPPSGNVTSYTPYVNGVAGTGSGTPASYTITGLTAGQTYSIMMQANMSITSGTAPNFLPTSIPGCALWLDAADTTTITKTGSNVTQWNDKSGNGNNATQSTSASQPTSGVSTQNGNNVITFTGTTKFMSYGTTNVSASTITVFCIFNNNTFTPYGEPVEVGPFSFFYAAPSSNVGIGRKGATDDILSSWSTNGLTTSQYVLYTGTVSVSANTVCNLFFNGKQVGASSASSSGGSSSYNVGAVSGNTTGNIGEVIVFNSLLTNLQRQTVEGYLAWKWGIQTSLPTTHPFYSTSGLTVSSVSFSPLSVQGCSVWLDAADSSKITLNGSGVSQWVDKSSNGFVFTQSTAGNQPTYSTNSLNGLATLQFTAANSTYLGGGTNYTVGTNSYAIFVVFRFSDTTSNGSVFNKGLYGGQQGRLLFVRENSGTFNFRVADPVAENNSFADTYAGNTYRIMCMTYNRTAGAGFIFNNGTLVSSYAADKTTNLTNTNNMIIGGYNNSSGTISPPSAGFYLNGNIAEIICYTNNYDMTWSTQQQIEGYLASKWGIRSYLNSTHPFYSVPALTNAYSTFNPKSISGLNVWWDGADPNGTGVVPVNGASIATWVDKSGNGYNATASVAGTYSSSPVGVNFGTTGYYTTSYPANPTNESCFIVFNKSSNNQMMMIGANTGGREVAMANGTLFGMVNSGVTWAASMSAGSATGVSHLGEAFVSGGTSTYVNFNGAVTLTGPSAVTAFTSGVLTNLGREAGASFQYLGYIQEILFYNSVLTLAQRQQVEGYLAWKWGVQTNLPVAHPYYSTSALAAVASVGPASITYSSPGSVVKSVIISYIPSGITGGSPTIYYPFWVDTKDYATGSGVTNATFNGTTPPSISTAVRYKSYAQNSLYSSNTSCNMSIPSVTINSSVGFSVCLWFYVSAQGMVWTANANPYTTRTFIYYTGSQIRVVVNGSNNDIYNVSVNTWYFITLVQPAGGVPYSSLNNGTITNLSSYAAVNYATSYHYLYGDPYVASNFGGAIGNVNNFYFFNRALSASEITAIYNQ